MPKKIKKDAVVLSARDLLNGYTAGSMNDFNLYNMTPLQMISAEEKDEEWKKWNLDWLERAGMRQLSRESRRLIKNYHLANGIIDKTDYVIGPDNQEMSDIISTISTENTNQIPIRFYPIIPNVINVLVGEHMKRDSRIIAKQVDEQYINEANEYKMDLMLQELSSLAEAKKVQQLMEMGVDLQDPQSQELVQTEIETAKRLATIETKFKNYRGIAEQWANHMIELDNQRFNMYNLENLGFRDSLVADREFWHIRVMEDDYRIELWNPVNTFYHKSPETQYISEGNYVGRIMMMSIPDVIDMYGDKMSEEQIGELKDGCTVINHLPLVDDAYKDQLNFYTDYSKPYPKGTNNVTWSRAMDSRFTQGMDSQPVSNNNFNWHDLSNISSDYFTSLEGPGMVRVTEAYWKSQMAIYELTIKKPGQDPISIIVDENYKVTEKPVYDKSIHQVEKASNLVSGEHLEKTWINQVRWGVKINSSVSSSYYSRNYTTFEPIYIGGDPIPFQFKGQHNKYGCKLPVEGKIFSERNSYSSGPIDKMKADQITFNILNNQVVEMLADEIGNVMVVDQNSIPRNSLNGEWGKYNFPMFHQVMRDYSVAAIDPSVRNTEGGTNFSHFQVVDLSKTQQILTRIQLADWVKNKCFEVVGITPQRLGAISASESATGTQQAVNNSYAQTEIYFDQHMNDLMPRVRQMMLDAAQFITATRPDSPITYLNSEDQTEFFNIEGYKLLMADFRIYTRSTADVKQTVENLRRVAMENNTAGGSLFELAQMMTLKSPAEIMAKLKQADDKRQQEVQAQRDHEMEMQRMQQEVIDKEAERQDYWKERDIQKDILVAEIRASQSRDNDVNADSIPDPLQAMDFIEQQRVNAAKILNDNQKMELERRKQLDSNNLTREEIQLRREEIASRERIEQLKARTARANPVPGERKKK